MWNREGKQKKIPELEPSSLLQNGLKKDNFLNIKKENDLCWVYLNRQML